MKVTIREWKLKKGRCLYLDIYHKGSRVRENLEIILDGGKTDAEKRRMAEILRSRKELELLSDIHGLIADHQGSVPLVELVKASTNRGARSSLPHLEKHFGPLQVQALTTQRIETYQNSLLESGLSRASVETYITGLIAVLNRAVRDRVIQKSPSKGMKRIKADEAPPSSLTREELATLERTRILGADGVGGDVRKAFFFACQTGLRWSDARKLRWGKIRDRQIEITQGKTREAVYVPLNEAAWAIINPGDRLPLSSEPVFPLIVSVDSAAQWVVPWGDSAGIPGLHFHQSRHTFIRTLLDSGSDLATAQGLAGHKKIETTARYGKASDKQKREAVERLGG